MTRFFMTASALLAAANLLLLALPAAAASDSGTAPGRSAAPDPADARAAVPPVRYRSAFSGYRSLDDAKVDWKEANDEVGRIGGWRTYAREANTPGPSSGAPRSEARPGATGQPEPDERSGHGGHGSRGGPDHDAHGQPEKN